MNLEPMWEALKQYQQHAEKRGFGAEWLRMTTERIAEAAREADAAATNAKDVYAADAAAHAAWATRTAAWRERTATNAANCAARNITRALQQENEMNLEPMWEALAEYQQYAEKHGFGAEWLKMTTERTAKTARGAARAALRRRRAVAHLEAAYAADAAAYVESWKARTDAERRVDLVVSGITRAIEQEQAS